MTRRLPDWRPRLDHYLEGLRSAPFAYGELDCALFVAGAVQAMTGLDPAAEYRGRYTTLKGGLKVLNKAGLRDHLAPVRQAFDAVPPAFAALGDIAVIAVPGDVPALGIFEGQHIIVLQGAGIGFVPRESATAAYRVP